MSDHMRFDDQVAVITGAGGGLGLQYALLLASRGARVVVNDIGAPGDEMAELFATIMAKQPDRSLQVAGGEIRGLLGHSVHRI